MSLLENFQQTGNVNNGHVGNVWRLIAAITEANYDVVQQVMQLRLDST